MDLDALKTLKQASHRADAKSHARHGMAEEQFHKAIELLKQFKKTDFQDKALDQEASQLLITSIQKNRLDARPYVALGYLVLIYGETLKGIQFLREALKLDPNNPDAQRLLNVAQTSGVLIKETPASESIAAIKPVEVSTHEPTPDQLDEMYEQTYDLILEQQKQVQSLMGRLKPTFLESELKGLQYLADQWFNFHQRLNSRLELLEREFEMDELTSALIPLHKAQEKLQEAISLSETMLALDQQLNVLQTTLTQQNESVASLVERYEAITHQLHPLKEKNLDLTFLLKRFNEVTEKLELLKSIEST